MPIYEFICRSCGERFDELVQANWRDADLVCPACQSDQLDRAVSRVGGFQSEGKIQMMDNGSSCSTCGTGSCSTCH